jgi:hypothetical protein
MPNRHSPLWTLVGVWLALGRDSCGYQAYVRARLRPERARLRAGLDGGETRADSQNDKPYLLEPISKRPRLLGFGILSLDRTGRLRRPADARDPPDFDWSRPRTRLKADAPDWVSKNYAFFPSYPYAIRQVAFHSGWPAWTRWPRPRWPACWSRCWHAWRRAGALTTWRARRWARQARGAPRFTC